MDFECLREADLSDGEIRVFTALLELGSSTTGPIVDKSKVSRSIVYQLLQNLMEKGLVSQIVKEKTKYFQAANPSKLLEYLNEREERFRKNRNDIELLLPQLTAIQNASVKSEANLYFGLNGIRTAHEHLYSKLKSGEEYCYLGVPAFQPDEQHRYWKKDHMRRVKVGIKLRVLFNRETDEGILKNRNSFKGCDARYMPEGIKTPASFLTFKDTTVIVLQHPNPIAVEIVNQEIADSFQAYFEEFWKRSKKIS